MKRLPKQVVVTNWIRTVYGSDSMKWKGGTHFRRTLSHLIGECAQYRHPAPSEYRRGWKGRKVSADHFIFFIIFKKNCPQMIHSVYKRLLCACPHFLTRQEL